MGIWTGVGILGRPWAPTDRLPTGALNPLLR